MQIVINIDEKLYSDIKTIGIAMGKIEYILEAIKHGVVLPKGHGINELPISSIDITDKNNLGVDCISKQAVKEQMIKYGFHAPDMTVTEFVEDLPPVNPQEPKIDRVEYGTDGNAYRLTISNGKELGQEPKTGHWIRVTDKAGHLVWECDKCSWQQRFNTNFCPNCGAKMED